jgi:hypothetical protein
LTRMFIRCSNMTVSFQMHPIFQISNTCFDSSVLDERAQSFDLSRPIENLLSAGQQQCPVEIPISAFAVAGIHPDYGGYPVPSAFDANEFLGPNQDKTQRH